MELKVYLRLLVKKWWIVLPTFVVTFALTTVFTFSQAPSYEAVTTFVVRPNASFEDVGSLVSGLDILSRRAEIASTYAEVANSKLIRNQAALNLGLSSEQRESLSVNSQVLMGTNVLRITVFGNDPVVVRDFAGAVGDETVVYVRALYEMYELTPLDRATLPTSPVKPNKGLNLALGAVLGLVLAMGLAVLAQYLQAPLESATISAILDEEPKEASIMADRLRTYSPTPSVIAANEQDAVSIDELGLPARITDALKGAGIESAEDLLKKDEQELLAIRGLGARSLEQVNAYLRARGFIKE